MTTRVWDGLTITALTQSHVVMQSALMSCDYMGLGEHWIHFVDPIPCGGVSTVLAVMYFGAVLKQSCMTPS